MLFNLVQLSAPAGLAVVAKPKFIDISWTHVEDVLFGVYLLKRYGTLADANADTNVQQTWRTTGNHIHDMQELTAGSVYYYRVCYMDVNTNLSALASEQHATWKVVQDGDTDATVIAAPTGLTLSQVTKRDKDGQIKTYVKMTCTPPAGVSGKVHYVYSVDNGADPVFTVKSDGVDARIPGEVGVTYAVQVQVIAFNGTKGTKATAVNITPVKKANDLPTPAGLSIAANSKRNKLDWTDIDDDTYPDYRNTAIWRNTANVTPVPGTTAIYKKTKAGYYVDDNLAIGTTYFYWIAHRDNSGNFSALAGPVSSAAVAIGTADLGAGSVTDAITDQTVPNTPAAPSVALSSLEIMDDGTVIANAEVTYLAPVGGIAVKYYLIKVTQTSNGKSKVYESDGLTCTVEVKTGKAYTYQVAAVGNFNRIGSYSSATSFTVPKKSATPSVPSGFSITPKPKGLLGEWTQPADADIRRYEWYVNTANNQTGGVGVVKVGNGDSHLYGKELVVGTAYYVFIRSVDTSGNVSAWVAASNNPQTYKAAASADIADNAVTPVKASLGDTSNMVRDPDMSDVSLWNGTTALTQTGTALAVASQNRLSLAASTSLLQIFSDSDIPVETGKQYFISGFVGPTNGVSAAFSIQVAWFSMDAAGVVTYITNSTGASFTGTGQQKISGIVTAPANARRAMIAGVKNASAGAADLTLYEPIFRKATESDLIAAGAVQEAHTDQTAPSAPTLTLNTVTADIDGDGSIDTALSLAILNPNTGVKIVRYVVEIHRDSAASPGVYTLWERRSVDAEDVADTLTTTWTFKANKNRLHKARARSVAFNGKKGTFSSLTSPGVQPTTVSGYNGKTASSPTVSPIANAVKVGWALTDNGAVALDTTIYKETEILVGGVTVAKVKGTAFTDTTARTPNTSYTYTLKHYDIHGNVTTVSAGVAVTWRNASAVAAVGDFDTFALAAPGSFTYTQDTNFDLNGDGTVDMVMKVAFGAVTNAASYEVEISRSTTLAGTYTIVGLGGITNSLEWRHICNVNYFYKARVRARNAYGQPGTWTALSAGVQPAAKSTRPPDATFVSVSAGTLSWAVSWGVISDKDYDYSEIATLFAPGTPSGPDYTAKGTSFGTYDTTNVPVYVYVRHVNKSGVKSLNWVLASGSPFTINRIDSGDLDANAIPDKIAAMAVNSVGSYAFLKNTTASAIAAGATTAAANLAFSSTSANTGGGTLSGTWMAMGSAPAGQATNWLRIS